MKAIWLIVAAGLAVIAGERYRATYGRPIDIGEALLGIAASALSLAILIAWGSKRSGI